MESDSNSVENLIRPIALNRKNALFAGHDEGGRAWGRIDDASPVELQAVKLKLGWDPADAYCVSLAISTGDIAIFRHAPLACKIRRSKLREPDAAQLAF